MKVLTALVLLLTSLIANAEYSAEIVFPDGEKKTYVLNTRRQELPDLKVGWKCSVHADTTKTKGSVLMHLYCYPTKNSDAILSIFTTCTDFGKGERGEISNPVILRQGIKSSIIMLRCK